MYTDECKNYLFPVLNVFKYESADKAEKSASTSVITISALASVFCD